MKHRNCSLRCSLLNKDGQIHVVNVLLKSQSTVETVPSSVSFLHYTKGLKVNVYIFNESTLIKQVSK